MKEKNTYVAHRYDRSDDYDKVSGVVERAGLNPSDRSVTKDAPLDSKGNYLMRDIYGKIDSASVVFTPARPSTAKEGSVARRELDYALKQGKPIVAVDTGATKSHATFFTDNNIPVVPARKDSIAKAVEKIKK